MCYLWDVSSEIFGFGVTNISTLWEKIESVFKETLKH